MTTMFCGDGINDLPALAPLMQSLLLHSPQAKPLSQVPQLLHLLSEVLSACLKLAADFGKAHKSITRICYVYNQRDK